MAYTKASRKATQKYQAQNSYSIAFRLSRKFEQDLIEIYQSIPKSEKAAWFKECLREYQKKHSE